MFYFYSSVIIYWWISNFQLYLSSRIFLFSFFSQKRKFREVLYKPMYKKNEHISFSFYMLTLTSYFGFLLAVLIITSSLFIGLSKIRLIWFVIFRGRVNFGIRHSTIPYYVNLQFSVIEIHDQYRWMFKDRYYLSFYFSNKSKWLKFFYLESC